MRNLEEHLFEDFSRIMVELSENAEDIGFLDQASSQDRTVRVRRNILESVKKLNLFRHKLNVVQKKRKHVLKHGSAPPDMFPDIDIP